MKMEMPITTSVVLWSITLLIYLTIQCHAEELVPALLGVNLGSNFISASYFNASGPVPLARLYGSESYRSFMANTLPETSQIQDPQTIHEMLKKTLSDVRDEARAAKGDLIRIGTISYPGHFNSFTIGTLFDAAHEFDPNLNHIIRFRPSHYGALLSYPLDYCSQRFADESRESEDDLPLSLIFEHDFYRLRIMLAEPGVYGPGVFLEDIIPWPTNQADIENIIRKQLQNVIAAEIPTIIISSDDATTDLSQISTAIAATRPELVPKIQVPVGGTQYVASIGAACIARQLAIFPDYLRPDDHDHAFLENRDEL